MDKSITEVDRKEFNELASEITYRRYMMDKVNLTKIFPDISTMDYIALWVISRLAEKKPDIDKIYLQDIAADLKVPMNRVSEMIQKLRDKGVLIWTHDGDGSEGTYVKLTESGQEAMKKQQEILGSYYRNVIEEFGKEEFVSMLQMLARLERIMDEESEKFVIEKEEQP